jgi:hypothetical protein
MQGCVYGVSDLDSPRFLRFMNGCKDRECLKEHRRDAKPEVQNAILVDHWFAIPEM